MPDEGKKRPLEEASPANSPKKRRIEEDNREEVRKVFGGDVLREWEVLICPELGVNPEGSIQGSVEELRTRLKADEVRLESRIVTVAENLVSMNQSLITGNTCTELLQLEDGKRKWHCDYSSLIKTFQNTAFSQNDTRKLSAQILSHLVSKSLYSPPPETVLAVLNLYDREGMSIIDVSLKLDLPPRTVVRYILESKDNVVCKKLWANPERFITDQRDLTSAKTAISVDTITSEVHQWERNERLVMVEKAIEKFLKLKGLKVLTRNNMPVKGVPKPSMFTSPCRVDGKTVNWFEVIAFYGLKGSEIEKYASKRVAALEKKYGPGCVLMPFGYDTGFELQSCSSLFIDPIILDLSLMCIDAALDHDLPHLRANFLRSLSTWTLGSTQPPPSPQGVPVPLPLQDLPELPPAPVVEDINSIQQDGHVNGQKENQSSSDVPKKEEEPATKPATTPKKPGRGSRTMVRMKQFSKGFNNDW
eukprot:TRINITY_DN6077_c0_g1_i3.p1 TRINITY_DN6077_c0_g1~~TRINITY_DN6077_c0_g1_i3.p1  ORF type:complete len:475 (+),score=62.78 TRINITY_DN6077_c0_g1_i3:94-1518(+)